MVALELNTGQRLWEINIAGISTPWVVGEWIFVVTDQAQCSRSRAPPGNQVDDAASALSRREGQEGLHLLGRPRSSPETG
jgi:hypothetical protein